jgi:hypothetical protein
LAVGHDQVDFGSVLDGVDDVGGTECHVEIRHIVLMEKSRFAGGDAHAKYADVVIFQDEMVVGFLGDRDGGGDLGVERKCQKQQRRAKKWSH